MIFVNRMAAFLWGFALAWLALVGLFTALLVRDGPPEEISAGVIWGILVVFWIAGFGLARYGLAEPCYRVSLASDGKIRFTWTYPHRRLTCLVPAADLALPEVVETEDDEGNPYFVAGCDLPDGRAFRLAEGHDRAHCAQACERFAAAVGRMTS